MNTNPKEFRTSEEVEAAETEILQELQEKFDTMVAKFVPETDKWELAVEDERNKYIKKLLDQYSDAGRFDVDLSTTISFMINHKKAPVGCTEVDYYNKKIVIFKDDLDHCFGQHMRIDLPKIEEMVRREFVLCVMKHFTRTYRGKFDEKKMTQWETAIEIIDTYKPFFVGYIPQDMIQWILTSPKDFETMHDTLDENNVLTIFINRNATHIDNVAKSIEREWLHDTMSKYRIEHAVTEFFLSDENTMMFKVPNSDANDGYMLLVDPTVDFKSTAQRLRELSRQSEYIFEGRVDIPEYPMFVTIKDAINLVIKRNTTSEE